jgi:hypothetical protein
VKVGVRGDRVTRAFEEAEAVARSVVGGVWWMPSIVGHSS